MQYWQTWLQERNKGRFHRQLIFFSGAPEWSYCQAINFVKAEDRPVKTLWLGDSDTFTVRGLPTKQYKKLLGQECNIAVYDAHCELKPSALLALSGTITANGVLIICCPSWHRWPESKPALQSSLISHGYSIQKSVFIGRWQRSIEHTPYIGLVEQNKSFVKLQQHAIESAHSPVYDHRFASLEQQQAFESITTSTSRTSFVITAKRGRGKSALLGLIADFYIDKGRNVTLCTALTSNNRGVLKHSKHASKINWCAPDDNTLNNAKDILLIDEAANLPIQQTLRILTNCKQFILSTTIEGYEGTGRGFTNKLIPKLKKQKNQQHLNSIYLNQPIRYHFEDGLEKHFDDLFYLTAIAKNSAKPNNFNELEFSVVRDKSELSNHVLADYMDLLSCAHYQTTPEDSVRMIDSPDNFFIGLYHQKKLLAVAVIIEEANNKLLNIAEGIACGERRAKGHQMAQKLSLLLSEPAILEQKIWRINRIAVSPELQGLGIGSYFLDAIEKYACQQHVSILGASFGSNPKTDSFWLKNNYSPAHIGNSADKSTGEVSMFVVKSLCNKAFYTCRTLKYLFTLEHADHYFSQYASHTDTNVKIDINRIFERRILDYINGSRSYHHVGFALVYWIEKHKIELEKYQQKKESNAEEILLLKSKWLSNKTENELLKQFKLNGRKKLNQRLWQAFASVYWSIA